MVQSEERADEIKDSSEQIQRMSVRFEKMIRSIFSNTESVENMTDRITNLASSSQEIANAMETETKNTEETTQHLVSMSHSISEQLKEIERIQVSINNLKDSFRTM
ncbi:hypothetical protein [Halalkalibacterium ligniniphilum]|uniref:hypothetical protein n=1 Tax=Halalkalibacterium ligniniphilum TaxID=1134413 RepID=UPI00037623D8|nr:hypothetical protein [Halalkalibacterium ligniniphilum]